MEVTIIETGSREELSIIDPNTGIDWTSDLMGNCNELPDYNDGNGAYYMPQEDFDWWDTLITAYQAADDRYHALLAELHGAEYDCLTEDARQIACDLEDYPDCLNQVCDTYEK